MHQRILAFSSIILLFSPAYTAIFVMEGEPSTTTTTTHPTTTTTTPSTTTTTKSTTKYYKRYGYGSGSKNNNKGYDNYYNDDDDNDGYNNNNNNKYNKGNDGYYEKGVDGIDPDKYGTDMGDLGQVYDNKKSMLSSLDLWIYSADDWEQKDSESSNKGKYKKSKKGKKYNNDDYKDGPRNKRSYSRVRFPTQQVRNFRQFPFGRMPPLISILPWLPIFYDKLTYQTFIFSPTGGIYIIPPLINFYGQRFAVAQLIKWGYASLVSTGAPPPPNVDVAPLVHPPPPAGGVVAAGVVGSASAGPGPSFDAKRHRFNDGVKTDFPNFKPRYAQTLEDGGNRNYGSSSGGNSDYGGTRNQQVYAQGGNQRSGGGGYNN